MSTHKVAINKLSIEFSSQDLPSLKVSSEEGERIYNAFREIASNGEPLPENLLSLQGRVDELHSLQGRLEKATLHQTRDRMIACLLTALAVAALVAVVVAFALNPASPFTIVFLCFVVPLVIPCVNWGDALWERKKTLEEQCIPLEQQIASAGRYLQAHSLAFAEYLNRAKEEVREKLNEANEEEDFAAAEEAAHAAALIQQVQGEVAKGYRMAQVMVQAGILPPLEEVEGEESAPDRSEPSSPTNYSEGELLPFYQMWSQFTRS